MKLNKRTLELAAKFGPAILLRGLIFSPENSKLLKELNGLNDQDIKDLVEYLDNFSTATINDYDKVFAAYAKNLKDINPDPLLKYLKQTKNLIRSLPLSSLADYINDRNKAKLGVESFKKITADLIRLAGDANDVDIKDEDFNAMLKAENDKAQTELEKLKPVPVPPAAAPPKEQVSVSAPRNWKKIDVKVPEHLLPKDPELHKPAPAPAAAPPKGQIPVSAPKDWKKIEVKIPEHLLAKGPGFHKQAPPSVAPEKVIVSPFEEKDFEIAGTAPQLKSKLGITAEEISAFDPEKTHGAFIQTIQAIQASLTNNQQKMPKTYQGKTEFDSFIQSLIFILEQIEENKLTKKTPIKDFILNIKLLESQIDICMHKLDNSPETQELSAELNQISDLIRDFYIQSKNPNAPRPTPT